jgi:hypothetical protein
MVQAWRNELRAWADQCAAEYQNKDGVLGVAIGGSLARGQEWRHSDLVEKGDLPFILKWPIQLWQCRIISDPTGNLFRFKLLLDALLFSPEVVKLKITYLWCGDPARDSIIYAVDSNFTWRQNAGILTVYRLYIPIIGSPELAIIDRLDDPAWAEQNTSLMCFLGLSSTDHKRVEILINRITDWCNILSNG